MKQDQWLEYGHNTLQILTTAKEDCINNLPFLLSQNRIAKKIDSLEKFTQKPDNLISTITLSLAIEIDKLTSSNLKK